MTLAQTIIDRCKARGIILYCLGDELRWQPLNLSREQVACLRTHQAAIVAEINARDEEVIAALEMPCGRLGKHERFSAAQPFVVGGKNFVEDETNPCSLVGEPASQRAKQGALNRGLNTDTSADGQTSLNYRPDATIRGRNVGAELVEVRGRQGWRTTSGRRDVRDRETSPPPQAR